MDKAKLKVNSKVVSKNKRKIHELLSKYVYRQP